MPQTVLQQIKKKKVDIFRRFSVRRRLDDSSGDYETNWQDLSPFVIKWGNITWSTDEKKFNFFTQRGMTITVDNSTGLFDQESSKASFWSGFLTRYRTLIKVEAGFIDPDDSSDIPNPSVLFYGILSSENIKQSDQFVVPLQVKSLISVLDEIPGNKLIVASGGATGQLTPTNLIDRIKVATDGSSNIILEKFISSGAWNIASTTANTLTSLNTTTQIDNMTFLQVAKRAAETEDKVVYIDRSGAFNYAVKTESASITFSFVGVPFRDSTYGHTIKKIKNYQEDIDNLFNRVTVKYSDADTDQVTKEETWTVGDSTTSWKYGVKTLSVDNDWMSAALADTIASNLFADLNALKIKVDIVTKFIPHLDLLDKVTIQYESDTIEENPLALRWGIGIWGIGIWGESKTPFFNFTGKDFKIIKMSHNLNKLESIFTAREI